MDKLDIIFSLLLFVQSLVNIRLSIKTFSFYGIDRPIYIIIQVLKILPFFIWLILRDYNEELVVSVPQSIFTDMSYAFIAWWVLGFLVRFFYIIKLFSDIISPILQVVRSFIELLVNHSSVIY